MTKTLIDRLLGPAVRKPSEVMRSAVGASLGVAAVGLISRLIVGGPDHWALLIAPPIAASAVVVFAAPTSPLAQPRAVIGGNMLSALIGVACGLVFPHATVAGSMAVMIAIAAMLLLGVLHPPGASIAFAAAIAPATVHWDFVLTPIGLGSVLLCIAGAIYAPLVGRVYPHKPPSLATTEPAKTAAPEPEGAAGVLAGVSCGEVMTAELSYVTPTMEAEAALAVLTEHGLRTAPLLDERRHVLGLLRRAELLLEIEREMTEGVGSARPVRELADQHLALARAETPLSDVLPMMATGAAHEVLVVDAEGAAVGVITQTDVLRVVWQGGATG